MNHHQKMTPVNISSLIYLLRILLLIVLVGILLFIYPSLVTNAALVKATADVNVRDRASMDSSVITSLKKGKKVAKTGKEGNWIQIRVGGQSGYVYKKYLKNVPNTKLYVKADAVNLRAKPSTDSNKLGLLYQGEKVLVLKQEKGWYYIKTKSGKTGHVCADYMSKKKVKKKASSPKDKKPRPEPSWKPDENTGRKLSLASSYSDSIESYRDKAIETAQTHLGEKYSQKKRNKDGYADCSSLMRDIFQAVTGQYIGGNTTSQADRMNEYMYPISSAYDAHVGDILYHLSSDNHTGIYLGEGKVLHASQSRGKVVISTFDDDGSFWEYGCNAALFCAVKKDN